MGSVGISFFLLSLDLSWEAFEENNTWAVECSIFPSSHSSLSVSLRVLFCSLFHFFLSKSGKDGFSLECLLSTGDSFLFSQFFVLFPCFPFLHIFLLSFGVFNCLMGKGGREYVL